MKKRFRFGIKGKLLGFLPFNICVLARDATEQEFGIVAGLLLQAGIYDGLVVPSATVYVTWT